MAVSASPSRQKNEKQNCLAHPSTHHSNQNMKSSGKIENTTHFMQGTWMTDIKNQKNHRDVIYTNRTLSNDTR